MSCFGGSQKQLYMLEFLVEKVEISAEKFKDIARVDGADCSIVVKAKYLDFPTLEISQEDFCFLKPATRNENACIDFSAGKACLFVKQPRDLVRDMQHTPLKIGIFCAGDTYPIAETEISLSGCLCDHIAMASNDPDHLPPPYHIRGGYYLTDPGDNLSGTINLELRLYCFGKSVTTHYQLNRKSFFFKNDRDDAQYYVRRILSPTTGASEAEKDIMKSEDTMLPTTLMPDNELGQVSIDATKAADEHESRIKEKDEKSEKKKSKKKK